MGAWTPHLFVDRPEDVAVAARALAGGAVVAVAFGNFYAVVTRPDAGTVRRVNLAKGRPAGQVRSITATPGRIADLFDWSLVPHRLPQRRVRQLMDALYGAGPFGFRGPAAAGLPAHLTPHDQGVRTTRVIAPGLACPSNAFFARAVAEAGVDHRPGSRCASAPPPGSGCGSGPTPRHWCDRSAAAGAGPGQCGGDGASGGLPRLRRRSASATPNSTSIAASAAKTGGRTSAAGAAVSRAGSPPVRDSETWLNTSYSNAARPGDAGGPALGLPVPADRRHEE